MTQPVVEVSIHIAAEQATVWRFMSDPARFAAWIGCFGGQPPLAGTSVDCKVGGQLRVEYPGGAVASGTITAIEPMRRVAFSWGNQSGPGIAIPPGSTQVEILLTPTDTGTRVTLRHAGLPENLRPDHAQGWRHYLSMLAKQASDLNFASALAANVDAYFQAWNEPDAQKRAALLDGCCEQSVRMRSAFAVADSLAEFKDHITNALKHMPGASLKPAGPAQQLHGFVRVPWGVSFGGGPAVMHGLNVARLSPSGKFVEIVSFGDEPKKP